MTDEMMSLRALLEKSSDADLLRGIVAAIGDRVDCRQDTAGTPAFINSNCFP
jgi:hypothetical protein